MEPENRTSIEQKLDELALESDKQQSIEQLRCIKQLKAELELLEAQQRVTQIKIQQAEERLGLL